MHQYLKASPNYPFLFYQVFQAPIIRINISITIDTISIITLSRYLLTRSANDPVKLQYLFLLYILLSNFLKSRYPNNKVNDN